MQFFARGQRPPLRDQNGHRDHRNNTGREGCQAENGKPQGTLVSKLPIRVDDVKNPQHEPILQFVAGRDNLSELTRVLLGLTFE